VDSWESFGEWNLNQDGKMMMMMMMMMKMTTSVGWLAGYHTVQKHADRRRAKAASSPFLQQQHSSEAINQSVLLDTGRETRTLSKARP
jgi:hypothetical protein